MNTTAQLENEIHEVARRIRALREDMNLSQEALAKKIGISADEYARLESGEEDFSFTFIYKIAQVCNVEMTDLMEGESPALSEVTVTRRGEGDQIVRREGFEYFRLASKFKNKLAEPFFVRIPYSQEALNPPYEYSTHVGQELDIVVKGSLKMVVGDNVEILHEGDSIYYNSAIPHNEIALGGEDCEIYAIVMNPDAKGPSKVENKIQKFVKTNVDNANLKNPVYAKYVDTTVDEFGVVNSVTFKNDEHFNFAFDVVDELAKKIPGKTAMIYVSNEKESRRFTFGDMSRYSNMAANYFASIGIKKGDRVLLVLKRHYQFWFSILGLHKLGAIVIPATHLLKDHDFEYRFNAAGISAIVCTGTGDVADQVDLAQKKSPTLKIKVMANGSKEGWHNFDEEFKNFPDTFERTADTPGGNDTMLMLFTSGTTGYPNIAAHTHKYPLGHFLTAKYWHNVDPNGLHFTIADTGWGKALANGDSLQLAFDMEAVPAYNITEGHLQFHPKGRDNGYVLTLDGLRIYIAGDTEDIPEMAALKDIDIAFLPCNQPYTMTAEQCVRAAQMIEPKVLIPYHFNDTDLSGLSAQLPGMDVRLRALQ